MQREHLGSRLGFLLVSAGCAIGIGNVWKVPWMTGQYGGGDPVHVLTPCLEKYTQLDIGLWSTQGTNL